MNNQGITSFFQHAAVQCPSLAFPAKGNLTLSGDTFGETANYSCNTGYNLIGERSLMCGSNGSWNGAPPTCQGEPSQHKFNVWKYGVWFLA